MSTGGREGLQRDMGAMRNIFSKSAKYSLLIHAKRRPTSLWMKIPSIDIYKHNMEEWIARTRGTTAPGLQHVEEAITNAGNWLIGGDLEVIQPIRYNDGLDQYRLSPTELCKEFKRRDADAVFAFQLRNPVHNGHALLMTGTGRHLLDKGYTNPVLF